MVSIVIPTYNSAQFITDTIQSVFVQTFTDWELIVVNDGSTDSTLNLLAGITHEKLKILDIPNGGVSNARNTGYQHSNGSLVAFLDSDDIWLPDNLEKKVNYLKSNPDVGLVHSDTEIIDENGDTNGKVLRGKEGEILDELLLWNETCIPAPSSILVRKEVISEVGGFNTDLSTAADQEFFFRVASKFRIGRIPSITWQYRVHPNNMHKNILRMEHDHIGAYKSAEKLGLFKSNSFRRKCFSNLYLILGASWLGDARNPIKGFTFFAKAILIYPMNIKKVGSRLWKKIF